MTWSVDFMADDWTRINSREVVRRALARLEAKGKGILLLHDIQPATALGLQSLLSELKDRGYRIVHVVPAGADRAPTITTAEQWRVRSPQLADREPSVWPRAFPHRIRTVAAALETPSVTSFGAVAPDEAIPVALVSSTPEALRGDDNAVALPTAWPEEAFLIAALPAVDLLPVPEAVHFRFARSPHPTKKNGPQPSRQVTDAADADVTGSIANRSREPRAKRSNHRPRKNGRTNTRERIESKAQIGHQIHIPQPTASLAPAR